MELEQIKVGVTLLFRSGLIRRVVAIKQDTPTYSRANLQNLNGKVPGARCWESLDYLANNTELYFD